MPPRSVPAPSRGAVYDVLTLGAGPAGLAASAFVAGFTDRSLLVDAGPSLAERDRHDQRSLTSGVGGAGLFSDGKFSFYPAASRLWCLDDPRALRASFGRLRALLGRHGLPCPPLPEAPIEPAPPGTERWFFKGYPAHYLPIEARASLTAELFAPSASPDRHRLHTRASLLPRGPDGLHPVLLDSRGEVSLVRARHVVLAGGRFYPMQAPEAPWPSSFRRLEFGVRIEDDALAPFFARLDGVDPKLRFLRASGEVEWRTFCMCRGGEVVASDTCGLLTASGRADGPPTGRSSVGLLTRVLDRRQSSRLAPPLFEAARRERALFRVGLDRALDGGADALLSARLGAEGAALAVEGLRLLASERPELLSTGTATLVGPAVEGVGLYPRIDGDLSAGVPGLWAAGDCAGAFRGLVAALLSGVYVAEKIGACLEAR